MQGYFQTSCTRTPQRNARVEIKHCHILNIARSLHFQGALSIDFLGECILMACHLINRTPFLTLDRKPLNFGYKTPL